VRGKLFPVEVKPHADCFAFFVVEFGVLNKAGFLIESQDAFVVFCQTAKPFGLEFA
jgi:hypothetical protein